MKHCFQSYGSGFKGRKTVRKWLRSGLSKAYASAPREENIKFLNFGRTYFMDDLEHENENKMQL